MPELSPSVTPPVTREARNGRDSATPPFAQTALTERAQERSEPPAVRFRTVSKAYGSVVVLRSLNLQIPTGQKVAIIGPSGSGKTTLLRLLMTLDRPDAGTIEVFGDPLGARRDPRTGGMLKDSERSIRAVRNQIGMVFQHFNLFPHMTALENVIEAPIHVRHVARVQARNDGLKLLEMVGVADKANVKPRRLSGGQQQRVAIARALAMRPRVMLLDEITSALDPETIGDVLKVVRDLAHETTMTMLIVTHEMDFAREVSDRVIFMEDGRVVEDDVPSVIFRNPASDRTRGFLRAVLER